MHSREARGGGLLSFPEAPLRSVRGALSYLLDLIFVPLCPICRGPLKDSGPFCEGCLRTIRRALPPICPQCGLPFPEGTEGHLCGDCLSGKYRFLLHRSYGIYDGGLREAIHRLKYGGDLLLVEPLGELLLEACEDLRDDGIDLLIPVPLHPRRLRERGFNQSLLLARHLSRRLGLLCEAEVLVKVKDTPSQTSLSPAERQRAVRGAFKVMKGERIREKRVLLVDDVFTTGATVNEASRVLLRAGAKEVLVITLARSVG